MTDWRWRAVWVQSPFVLSSGRISSLWSKVLTSKRWQTSFLLFKCLEMSSVISECSAGFYFQIFFWCLFNCLNFYTEFWLENLVTSLINYTTLVCFRKFSAAYEAFYWHKIHSSLSLGTHNYNYNYPYTFNLSIYYNHELFQLSNSCRIHWISIDHL